MAGEPGAVDPALLLLRKWQDEQDVDALDELLRLEGTTLADPLRRRGADLLKAPQTPGDPAREPVPRLLGQPEPPQFEDPRQLRAYLWKAAWRLLLNRSQSASRRVARLSLSDSSALENVLATTGGLRALEDRER